MRPSHPLDPLLAPRSMALVGASPRPHSFGNEMVRNANDAQCRVFLVNPRHERIDGNPCYPDLAALPERVEHVVLCVANERLEEALVDAARHGARAATIFASAKLSPDREPPLAARIQAIAADAGMAICGCNGMGFSNVERGLHVSPFPFPRDLVPGPVAWIAQSGSVYGALTFNERRFGYSVCVSSGAETTTTAADYVDWTLERTRTRVIALFLEAIRDAERFVAAIERAYERAVPVVVVKTGRTAASAAMARTHTGAIAGSDAAFDALCERHGVLRVDTIDDLAATVALFASGRRAAAGGLASVHDSGGECELIVDLAADLGVPFARIAETTRQRLTSRLEPGLEPSNPLDAWASGNDVATTFAACLEALHDDPDTGACLLSFDARDGAWHHTQYLDALEAAWPRTTKPLALATNFAGTRNPETAARLARQGIPLLEGTRTALGAVARLMTYRDHRARDTTGPPAPPAEAARTWRAVLGGRSTLDAEESFALLRDFGIDTPSTVTVARREEIAAAAAQVGFPLVMKTAAPGIDHRSRVGGVRLGIDDVDAAHQTYDALCERLGPRVTLSATAPAGIELAFGVVQDAQFGPVAMVGAGGTLVEHLHDRVFLLAPFSAATARHHLERLRVGRLLDGVDVTATAASLSRLSVLAAELGRSLRELDINPLIASPVGCVAVDALFVVGPERTPPAADRR